MTRRSDRAIVATGALLLTAYLAAMLAMPKPDGRVVVGDATHHFVQLRSLVYDGDLHFRNEYIRLYGLDGYVPGTEWIYTDLTPTGHLRNYMPVGPALLWAPLYLLMSAALLVASWAGLARPPDGFDWLLQLTPGATGIVAATLAAMLSWRTARAWTSDRAATIGVLAAWMGTHAVYYSLVSPAYSHAASMLTSALLFGSWMGTRDRMSTGRIAWWGALTGVCALMRWQDAIFLMIPAIEAMRWPQPIARRLFALGAAGAAFLLAFSPQMAVWSVLYGQPFALPQGPSFMQWTSPHPFAVLFSDNHGLLSWAPMIVPALAGLVMATRRQPAWTLPLAAVLLVSWYVNAAAADWWAGEAFGARRFLSLFPLFAVGIGAWISGAAGAAGLVTTVVPGRVAVVVVLGALNWLLLLQYQIYMKGLHDLAAYPQFWFDMWLERFAVPWRLVEWLLR
jgi:hypothetical protein